MKTPRFYVQGLNKNLVFFLGYSRNFPRFFKLSQNALINHLLPETLLDLSRKYAGHLWQCRSESRNCGWYPANTSYCSYYKGELLYLHGQIGVQKLGLVIQLVTTGQLLYICTYTARSESRNLGWLSSIHWLVTTGVLLQVLTELVLDQSPETGAGYPAYTGQLLYLHGQIKVQKLGLVIQHTLASYYIQASLSFYTNRTSVVPDQSSEFSLKT